MGYTMPMEHVMVNGYRKAMEDVRVGGWREPGVRSWLRYGVCSNIADASRRWQMVKHLKTILRIGSVFGNRGRARYVPEYIVVSAEE
jgi:hypothetical protein